MSGETVFRRAFADEPNLSKIYFDCEAGGFFLLCRQSVTNGGLRESIQGYGRRY